MRNKSISKALAVLLSFVFFVSSSAGYVYAEPASNEIEAECETAELITEYEEVVSEGIYENEITAEELESETTEEAAIESESEITEEVTGESVEESESSTVESESETEEAASEIMEELESAVEKSESETVEETQSDDTEVLRDFNEQEWDEINSGILEEYDTLMKKLKDGSIEFPYSGFGISENNEAFASNESAGVCTGSRLNYIKKYIIANGVKSENKYTVAAKLTNNNTTFSMQYDSSSTKVEFILLLESTSSSGTVANFMTSFYAEDNAAKQNISYVFLTETSPQMAYTAAAEVNPAELKQDDVVDFSIDFAYPESMRSAYDEGLDELASSSLELLLLGMDIWFTQIFGSNVTIGNFGFLCYASPATNHIWGDWVSDEDSKYRTCDVCGEIQEYTEGSELDGDWKYDVDTGIKWKFSEGVLTVAYEGHLDYEYNMPWEDVSEDVTTLILQEGITGFDEDVTYDLPNLIEIQIPVSCTDIEDVWFAFNFNDMLEKIDVLSGNPKFSSVNGVLYNKSGEKLLFYPYNKPNEVFTLPDACTEIDDLYSYNVKELDLGSNLKTINGYVGGENIVLIRIPATLQNIGGAVFDVTEKLQNIIIDEGSPYLCYEDNALLSKDKKIIYEVMPCISSTTYKIPSTVEEIFSEAFFYNNKIEKLIIPENVKKIGNGAFADMRKIEKICLLSTTAQFTGMPFSTVGKDEPGTFYVPNEYAKTLVEGILKRCNINNVKLIVDTSLDVSEDEYQEEEPNDSFATAMTLPMGEKVLATIGNGDKKDYYSIFVEREYAQTIYIENLDNLDNLAGYITIYDASQRFEEMCTSSKFQYDALSNSYYYSFTVGTTGNYYICINSSSLKEVPYGITYKNNSKDTSLDEEISIETGKKYAKTVTVNAEYMDTLKNYMKQYGEYEDDKELEEKRYIISETGKTSNEVVALKYAIDYDGTEWIWFTVCNYHKGLLSYPYEYLVFGWMSDGKNAFRVYTVNYTYTLDSYCDTHLRTEIDITNEDYGKIGCDFKFTSKNYSDIYDNEQVRKNATEMYNDALWRWEELLERAEGKEGFKFSDLVMKDSSSELSPDDTEDNYSVYYTDQRTDLSGCAIANIKSKVYNGKAYTPIPKVTMFIDGKNKSLVYGTDYRLVYTNNINAGQGTVTVLGIGKYKGSHSKSFSITGKNMGKLTKLASSIAVGDSLTDPIEVYDGTKLLTKGVDYDYTITESDVRNAGTAKIVVSALPESNYVGTSTVKVPVINDNGKILINASDITLSETEYAYDGKPHTPGVTVNVDGTTLQKKDYSVTYKNNKDCGIAYVIVKGKGQVYTGTAVAFFSIVTPTGKASFDSVVVNKGKNVIYNAKLQKPKVIVMMNGKKLAENKDYTLEYANHFNAGWGKVKITGIGNYEGLSKDATFKIEQRMIKNASISVKSSTNYTVKYAGKVLVEGIDYEVERQEIFGTNKVNLIFKGLKNFSGEITKKNVKK